MLVLVFTDLIKICIYLCEEIFNFMADKEIFAAFNAAPAFSPV
jgi:hypothetical protein